MITIPEEFPLLETMGQYLKQEYDYAEKQVAAADDADDEDESDISDVEHEVILSPPESPLLSPSISDAGGWAVDHNAYPLTSTPIHDHGDPDSTVSTEWYSEAESETDSSALIPDLEPLEPQAQPELLDV